MRFECTSLRPMLLAVSTGLLLAATSMLGQEQTVTVAPDSPQWDLGGEDKAMDYQGRKKLYLNGGEAELKAFDLRDGVIDVDVATPASRGFFGVQFRIVDK